MIETSHVENLVLGGGEAGKYVAWELAQQGRSVVVIERALIGGSCPNIACLPSKNMIRSAKVADLVSRAASYGVRTEVATVEMEGVRRRKREMVDGMIAIHRKEVCGAESQIRPRGRPPRGAAHSRGETP